MEFKVIKSGDESIAKEVEKFGEAGAMHYQNLLFRLMDQLCGGEYQGGTWELREYEDGTIVWIFDQDRQIKVNTFNGYDVTCAMSTVALAANLIAHSVLMGQIADRNHQDPSLNKLATNADSIYAVARTLSKEERSSFARIVD